MKRPPAKRAHRLTAFPLYGMPRPWPVSAEKLAEATDIKRINENLVKIQWGLQSSTYAAICVGLDPPWVQLELARLSKDPLEVVDVDHLKQELLSPGEGRFFADCTYLLVDCSVGLALGEFKPSAVGVVGERPASLINKALAGIGLRPPIELPAFPSPDFRKTVLGHSVKKFRLKMGPAGGPALESEGFGSDAVRKIIERDEVLALDISIKVKPTTRASEERASVWEGLAKRLGVLGAESFQLTTDDNVPFDLIQEKFVRYEVNFALDDREGATAERKLKFGAMRQELERHREDLNRLLPKTRTHSLTEFGLT